jgi:hypothetical protein
MEKISDGKQCEAKDGTPEIEIMTCPPAPNSSKETGELLHRCE